MFSLILNQYDQAKSSNISTFALSPCSGRKIITASRFKKDTSVELISRMAEQLVSLVQIYDLVIIPSNKELERVHLSGVTVSCSLDDDTVPVSLMDFYEQLLLNQNPPLKEIKPLSVSVFMVENHPEAVGLISLPELEGFRY